ncbi:MAG: nucleotidyltransferase family protein [bacterium]
MKERDEILQCLREKGSELFAAAPVSLAYIYGSYARGKYASLSDIDIALVVDENVPESEYLRYSSRDRVLH